MKPKVKHHQEQKYLNLIPTLEDICDLSHPLIQLAKQIDWERFERECEPLYCDGVGCPAKPTRLMVSLHYLKYTYSLSDEEMIKRWLENPYWQYFSGEMIFQTEPPIDPSSMTNWRKRMGEDRIKILFTETIRIAQEGNVINTKQMSQVIVDTTVEEKNISFPTDSKLLYRAIQKLVKLAKSNGIKLRQTYTKKAKEASLKAGRYGHARQWQQQKREIKNLKNWLGRIVREIKRYTGPLPEVVNALLARAERLLDQEKNSKGKLYSLNEPEVQCIGKGKARVRYEFGQKVSIVTSNTTNFILNVQVCPDNPYDGHTLAESISGTEMNTGVRVKEIMVDKGYRGHDYKGPATVHIAGSSNSGLPRDVKRRKRRRSAIEPVIGHMKSEHRLGRSFLKGLVGDSINLFLSAAGKNLRKLLTLIAKGRFSLVFLSLFVSIFAVHKRFQMPDSLFHASFSGTKNV